MFTSHHRDWGLLPKSRSLCRGCTRNKTFEDHRAWDIVYRSAGEKEAIEKNTVMKSCLRLRSGARLSQPTTKAVKQYSVKNIKASTLNTQREELNNYSLYHSRVSSPSNQRLT